jgi:hypothetical protein
MDRGSADQAVSPAICGGSSFAEASEKSLCDAPILALSRSRVRRWKADWKQLSVATGRERAVLIVMRTEMGLSLFALSYRHFCPLFASYLFYHIVTSLARANRDCDLVFGKAVYRVLDEWGLHCGNSAEWVVDKEAIGLLHTTKATQLVYNVHALYLTPIFKDRSSTQVVCGRSPPARTSWEPAQ